MTLAQTAAELASALPVDEDDERVVEELVRRAGQRRPPPHETLVNALQGRVCPTSGRLLAATPIQRAARLRALGFEEPNEEQRATATLVMDLDLALRNGGRWDE